jgi:PAS domain S-box-containing protein
MRPMPLSTTQKLRWGLYGATALAGLIVAIGFLNTTELTRRAGWVRHSASIVTELEVLQARITDAETGQRGYLLTRDPRYLEPYHRAGPGLDHQLPTLDSLLVADTVQRAALDSLRPLLRAKLVELQRTIALDSTAGPDAARTVVSTGQGKAVMDSIRTLIAHMLDREHASLAARTREQRLTASLSEVVLLTVLAIVAVLCLMGRRVVDRDDRQRTAATAEILRLRDLAEEEAARSEEETARAEDEAARAEEFATQADDSRERLEGVLAGISDGFLVMDRDLTVLFINAQGAEMLGRTPAELLQQSLWSTLPAGRESELDHAFRRALASRDILRLEVGLPGTSRWVSTHIYPAGDNLSVFFQDVTERVEAERRARAGDERLRVALDAGRFGVWEWDMGVGLVTWSDRTHELHGVPVGTFGGRLEDFTKLVHADDLGRVTNLIQGAIRDRLPYEVEFRVIHPDGSVHWLATAGRVLYEPDGRPARMLGVTWERTQQRLEEETARHAQRMEAIGRLAGGIAHEVNNQMSVVLGFAQFLLKRTELPADVRSDVTEIHRAGERSAAITSQLLAFSRRQLLRPELLDLTEVVSRFERVVKRTLGEASQLDLRLETALPRVEADRGQVEQVLLNLALNAADAMPNGGRLIVTTRSVLLPRDVGPQGAGLAVPGGPYVRLTVSDTGHGMDASVLAHVFEPFFTTKPLGKGTGLGLSTVYGIVKQSGGYVWVDSAPGAGTSVHVDFPVARTPAPTADGPTPAIRTTPARGLVMVVEDEPAVRAMVSRVLEEEGYDVVVAQDGREALSALADRNGVRLVVSDVAMPVMSGRELGDMLARTHPDLPVLYMSGFADDEIVSRGLLEPGRPFIQKPFPTDLFTRRVAELLQQRAR